MVRTNRFFHYLRTFIDFLRSRDAENRNVELRRSRVRLMKNAILVLGFLGLVGSVLGISVSNAQIFRWPISPENRQNLGQDYAQYYWGSSNNHHAGVDIAAPEGTPLLAAAAGIIRRLDMRPDRFNGDNHWMGNVVINL